MAKKNEKGSRSTLRSHPIMMHWITRKKEVELREEKRIERSTETYGNDTRFIFYFFKKYIY